MSELPVESSINESMKEAKYDALQSVNKSGSCSKSGCREDHADGKQEKRIQENDCDHVDVAIGMNTSIGDEAALVFASQFYSSIGFGKSIKTAIDQAKAALMLEGIPEKTTPELYVRDSLKAEDLMLVKP